MTAPAHPGVRVDGLAIDVLMMMLQKMHQSCYGIPALRGPALEAVEAGVASVVEALSDEPSEEGSRVLGFERARE